MTPTWLFDDLPICPCAGNAACLPVISSPSSRQTKCIYCCPDWLCSCSRSHDIALIRLMVYAICSHLTLCVDGVLASCSHSQVAAKTTSTCCQKLNWSGELLLPGSGLSHQSRDSRVFRHNREHPVLLHRAGERKLCRPLLRGSSGGNYSSYTVCTLKRCGSARQTFPTERVAWPKNEWASPV